MTQKRRKPTNAQVKQKKQSARIAVANTGFTPRKNPPFSQIEAEAKGRKIVLHIGCGSYNPEKLHRSFHGDDWFELRLDIDPSVNPHIATDMLDLSMVPDCSVDAVWSSHNIEHLFPHDVPKALEEIFRVIKFSGHFIVTLPDIQTVANYVAHGKLEQPIYDSPAGPICPIDILYGFRSSMARGNLFMAHRTGFTAETLAMYLRNVGFCNIRVQRKWVDLWAVAHKYHPQDPMRNERIELVIDKQTQEMVLPAPLPLNRTPHPGMLHPNTLTDELNMPPKYYQPLGLNSPSGETS